MAFIQQRLDRVAETSRDVFDIYVYRPDNGDTLADIGEVGYFDRARFAGAIIESGLILTYASDGFGTYFINNEVPELLQNTDRPGAPEVIDAPNQALERLPVTVFRKDGKYSTNFNPKDWEPHSFDSTFYVSQSSGNNSNAGSSAEDAFQDIDNALDAVIAASGTNFELIILDGYFDRLTGWRGRQIGSKNIVVRCLGDVTSSGEYSGLTWTDQTGGVFSTTRTATGVMYDKVNLTNGEWTQLQPVDSITECQNTSNSTFTDGTTLYIHRSDDLEPTESNTMVGTTTLNVRPAEDGLTMIYGMKIYGSSDAISCNMGNNTNSTVILVNCESGYSETNAADFNGARRVINYQCKSVGAGNDGFNYQAGASNVEQLVAEIDCTSIVAGEYATDTNNNASSIHDDGRIVRVNCNYAQSRGPVVNDVNNAISWCLGCKSGGTIGVTGLLSTSWSVGAGATMYLEDCEATGAAEFDAVGNGQMLLRNCPTISNTSGNVSSY